jgi:hypothetical protein
MIMPGEPFALLPHADSAEMGHKSGTNPSKKLFPGNGRQLRIGA